MLRSIDFGAKSYSSTDKLMTVKDFAKYLTQKKRKQDKKFKNYTATNHEAYIFAVQNFDQAVYVDDQGNFYWSTYKFDLSDNN